MNIKAITMKNPVSFFSVVISIVVAALIVTACNKHGAEGKPDDIDYYTCTMHPSVKSQDPKAKCPICGMDLVPVMKKGATDANATATMSDEEKPSEFAVPV